MRYAAFFRNLNLGRLNCPSRAQFEAAFLEAGAGAAASFLVNGTIAFDARSLPAARKVMAAASRVMARECGLREPGFLRELADLERLVEADPFAAIDPATVYSFGVSFLHPLADARKLPWASPSGDVEIIAIVGGEVLSLSRVIGKKSPGSPNAFLERALGLPATSRVWNTVVRLVRKHGPSVSGA